MTRHLALLFALLCIACGRPAPETLRPARYIDPSHDRISEVTDLADGTLTPLDGRTGQTEQFEF